MSEYTAATADADAILQQQHLNISNLIEASFILSKDTIRELREKEVTLLIAFKNDTNKILLKCLKKEYRDVCSHGDVIVNGLLKKYAAGRPATDDELYYVSFIYDSYMDCIWQPEPQQ